MISRNGRVIDFKAKPRLYFAYGSNLNVGQMKHRCMTATPYAQANLEGWTLEYRGPLTIVKKEGGVVHGGLWLTKPLDELCLDRYEGWPNYYRKEDIEVTIPGRDGFPGQKVKAYVYIMNGGTEHAPGFQYMETCVEGSQDPVWREGIPASDFTAPLVNIEERMRRDKRRVYTR